MSFSRKYLEDLCAKTGATFVCDDDFLSAKNKEKVTFKCGCGKEELVVMEVRNMRRAKKDDDGEITENPSAYCPDCMKIRKSERISKSKTQKRDPITNPVTQQKCSKKKCGRVFDKSEFTDDNGNSTLLCKKCRDYARDFAEKSRQKKKRQACELKLEKTQKWCNACNQVKDLAEFIHEVYSQETTRCRECRQSNKKREQFQKEKLKDVEPEEGKRKCIQCLQSRDVKFFFTGEMPTCNLCVDTNKRSQARKVIVRKKERAKVYTVLTGKVMCDTCGEGFVPEMLVEGKCEICRTTRVCTRCEKRHSNDMFLLKSTFPNVEDDGKICEVCDSCRRIIPDELKDFHCLCSTCLVLTPIWFFSDKNSACLSCSNTSKKYNSLNLGRIEKICQAEMKKHEGKLSKQTLINYKCFCETNHAKTFETIFLNGMFCDSDQKKQAAEKRKFNFIKNHGTMEKELPETREKIEKTMVERYGKSCFTKTDKYKKGRIIYTHEYLNKLVKENDALLLKIINEPLRRESSIEFECSCGNIDQRNFVKIHETQRVLCDVCISDIAQGVMKQTMMNRYGAKNAMHIKEFAEKAFKNQYRKKKFIFPSGTIILCQGFEHFALRDLFAKNVDEKDVACGDHGTIPTIEYFFDGKKRKYYPDIFLLKENRIIEVKSTFTMNSAFEKNMAKRDACISKGFKFEFWVYSRNGSCEIQ